MAFWRQAAVEAAASILITGRRLPVFFGDINKLGALHWSRDSTQEMHICPVPDQDRVAVVRCLLEEQLQALPGMLLGSTARHNPYNLT